MEIRGLFKSFGSLEVFKDFSLSIRDSRITALMGPSGCGKTTLLNMISGLEKADKGTIEASDGALFIFQEPRLLPWKTALENVEIVLETLVESPLERRARAIESLEMMRLGDKLDSYPSHLSGGQRQRVALARAFCLPAKVLLMDEPFSSLDSRLVDSIMKDFLAMYQKSPRTAIFVTHDGLQAGRLADEVVLLGSSPCTVLDRFIVPSDKASRSLADALKAHDRIERVFEQ